ncbi:MAG: hypothetical protein HPY50_07125 [Firmicutes bacterium]|nr:hypothetical protein [Bacillota bacterium]
MKGRSELISLMLGILYALGPAGGLHKKLVGDALTEFRSKPMEDHDAELRTLAEKAVASVCSYDESCGYREGWEYLSSDAKSRRGSEEWLQKAREERKAVPRAVFTPTGTGEVLRGSDGDLAAVEVFGINSEYTSDGVLRESRGIVLAGFFYNGGKWLLHSISWYPESDSDDSAPADSLEGKDLSAKKLE